VLLELHQKYTVIVMFIIVNKMMLTVIFMTLVSSEVHLVQKQLTQAENDNAALRTDKGKLETKAGHLV